jgi:hypothetical protein
MLAQALIEFPDGQASLIFNADVTHGQEDHTFVTGNLGSVASVAEKTPKVPGKVRQLKL